MKQVMSTTGCHIHFPDSAKPSSAGPPQRPVPFLKNQVQLSFQKDGISIHPHMPLTLLSSALSSALSSSPLFAQVSVTGVARTADDARQQLRGLLPITIRSCEMSFVFNLSLSHTHSLSSHLISLISLSITVSTYPHIFVRFP